MARFYLVFLCLAAVSQGAEQQDGRTSSPGRKEIHVISTEIVEISRELENDAWLLKANRTSGIELRQRLGELHDAVHELEKALEPRYPGRPVPVPIVPPTVIINPDELPKIIDFGTTGKLENETVTLHPLVAINRPIGQLQIKNLGGASRYIRISGVEFVDMQGKTHHAKDILGRVLYDKLGTGEVLSIPLKNPIQCKSVTIKMGHECKGIEVLGIPTGLPEGVRPH